MSLAGFSLETATRRGGVGVEIDVWEERAEEMRVCIEVMFSAKVEAREDDMGIFMSLEDDDESCAVVLIMLLSVEKGWQFCVFRNMLESQWDQKPTGTPSRY